MVWGDVLLLFSSAPFPILIRGQHLKQNVCPDYPNYKRLGPKTPVPVVRHPHQEVQYIWGETKSSFASNGQSITISSRIPTLTHSSASLAATCSSTFMFIHPSFRETCNRMTNLHIISTVKRVTKCLWDRNRYENKEEKWGGTSHQGEGFRARRRSGSECILLTSCISVNSVVR